MRHLLLLGGGHAHVEVVRRLVRAPWPDVRISLVSPQTEVLYSGMVPGMLAGHYPRAAATFELPELARRGGVHWIRARASAIDAGARRVRLADGRGLDYDLLSLDVGSVTDRAAIPGAAQHALAVRPIEDFAHAVDLLLARGGRRFLGVVLVGGGAAAVELALALQHRLGQHARVTLVTGGTPPLPDFGAGTQARALAALQRAAIAVVEDRCVEIGARRVRLAGGGAVACDAAVLATGASAARWLRGSGLQLDAQGYIATGADLQSLSHPGVFAVGDTAARTDTTRPRSGVYAVRAGPPLAANLRRWLDAAPLQPHCPAARSLNLLACGDRYAIASWGAWSAEGRWVWWWKDAIDRRYVARYR